MTKETIIPKTPTAEDYSLTSKRGLIQTVSDPFELVETWLADARKTEINDSNAMALATVDADGLPDVRMVLLKDYSAEGFTFYTHETSAKGQQLLNTPKAALLFHWKSQRRQIRVRGKVEPVPDAAADAYFASRARQSQLGAWASDQSQPLASAEALKAKLADVEARFADVSQVPRPPAWRGFRIAPVSIEFWQDQPFRLHDRLVYTRANETWTSERLNP